jgi:tetratricopeptide (TPR) repeat protein
MEDRLFFALFVPLSLVVFLGIPALLLTTLGPELDLLRVDDAAAAAMASSLRTGTSASAAEQRLQQHTPLCDVDEEAALAGQLRAATHSSVLEPVLERLWECWLGERGRVAQDYLDSGTDLMSSGQLSSAARIFQSAREQYPGWAEATNKLATVYYLQGKLRESAVLCREVLGEKPHHFGAASGLVQVLVGLDELDEAMAVALDLNSMNRKLGGRLLEAVRAAKRAQEEHEKDEL